MAQPAAARRVSATADQRVESVASASSVSPGLEAKTQTHPPNPSLSSTHEPNAHNCSDKMFPASSVSRNSASTAAKSSEKATSVAFQEAPDASSLERALQSQEEARRLQFALAQQQVQQYHAMTKQVETHSGIPMTPSSAIGSCSPTLSTINTSVAGLSKTSTDFQKLRHEQLAKLQQTVQRQAALAAQAVQKQSTTDEWLRNKLRLEQEHLRSLRAHEQQLSLIGKGHTVSTATATSIADSLLAQQQQVLRQQQMLREMLQKQQKQQQAQLQLQLQLKKGEDTRSITTTSPLMTSTTVSSKASVTAASTYFAVKKKVTKNAFELDMEALARICIRVANARTDGEMRQALEKLTTWLHRCTELPLLEIAQRDYRDALAHRRPLLIQQDRWPLELQVQSEYITQKMVQMLGAFLLREKSKTLQQEAAIKAAKDAAESSKDTTTGSFNHTTAPAASTSITLSTDSIPTSPAITNTVMASPGTSTTSTSPLPARVLSSKSSMAVIEREYTHIKAQLHAKQVETNQKAKAKRDAAKLEAAKAAKTLSSQETTAAMLAATYKRPLQVDLSTALKKQRIETTTAMALSATYRPSTTSIPPISPRVAQQFYDFDVNLRTSTDVDDKMYLPSKIVSKIMYRALPGGQEDDEEAATNVVLKREEHEKTYETLAPVSISDDAVNLMQECVTEFLLYLTSEARDFSVLENRRTKKGVGLSISGVNVVESMENLGLTSYARVLAGYNDKVKASQDAAARMKMERKKRLQEQAVLQASVTAGKVVKEAAVASKKMALSMAVLSSVATRSRPDPSVSVTSSRPVPVIPARTEIESGGGTPVEAVATTTTATLATSPAKSQ